MKMHKRDNRRRVDKFAHSMLNGSGLHWPYPKHNRNGVRAYYFINLYAIVIVENDLEIARYDIDNVTEIHWNPDPLSRYQPDDIPNALWDKIKRDDD